MQQSVLRAALLLAMQEATDRGGKAQVMEALTHAISVMIAASCLCYHGDEGQLLDGIQATCNDIRVATANSYVSMRKELERRGQNT